MPKTIRDTLEAVRDPAPAACALETG